MIEEKDIELYLKAKKDRLAIDILLVLSSLCLGVLIYLEATNSKHDLTILLATISVVLSLSAFGKSRWVSVSRNDLVNCLGRVISNDSGALKIIASKSQN